MDESVALGSPEDSSYASLAVYSEYKGKLVEGFPLIAATQCVIIYFGLIRNTHSTLNRNRMRIPRSSRPSDDCLNMICKFHLA